MGAAGQRAISSYKRSRDRGIQKGIKPIIQAARRNAAGRKVKRRTGKTARSIVGTVRRGTQPTVEFGYRSGGAGPILEAGRRQFVLVPRNKKAVFIKSGPLAGRFFARVTIPAKRGIPLIGAAVKEKQGKMNQEIHRQIVPAIDKGLSRTIEVR